MTRSLDVAVVGAGIVGLAHAWSAAQRGCRVTVFDRSSHAQGASIRNFGMIWPIGQPPGLLRHLALLSRKCWLTLKKPMSLPLEACGSIHLAHHEDEWQVLEEFALQAAHQGIECSLLTPAQILERTPAANPAGLLGGLFSPTELCVNPVVAVRRLAQWLEENYAIHGVFQTQVIAVSPLSGRVGRIEVRASDGTSRTYDTVIICSGADLQTLFPRELSASGLRLCKLQMLKTKPQPQGWRQGPHLTGGLTLRHYRNFEQCPGLERLRQRIAAETPELERVGIHAMAAQNDLGEVMLGTSHEYDDLEPFDSTEIEELILRELRRIICLPEWSIAARWHGIYAEHPTLPVYEAEPISNVHLVTGIGGHGMTLAFGLAEQFWEQLAERFPRLRREG